MINDLALILVMLVVYQFLHVKMKASIGSEFVLSIVSGVLFGIVGIVSMLDPSTIAPGVSYDSRTIVLGIAGVFGGPLAASIAATMCVIARLFIGQQGAYLGILTIVEAATLGVVYHQLVKAGKIPINPISLGLLALTIHGARFALNLLQPDRFGLHTLPIIEPTVLILFPVIFVVIASIFLFLEKSQREHEDLFASELRYRTMFEHNAAVMLLIDPENGRIVDANDAAASFYGYSRQTLRQMKINQINALDQEETQKIINQLLRLGYGHVNLRHRNASGELRDVEIYGASIAFEGRTLLYEIIHDVTDRERARREQLLLYEAIDESFNEVYIFDNTSLHFIYASQGALRNLGYTLEQMRELTPMDLKQDMPESEFLNYINQLRTGEKSNVVFQSTHTRADKSKYPVEVRLYL